MGGSRRIGALACAVVLVCAAPAAADSVSAPGEPLVRVLLLETPEAVRVAGTRLAPGSGGVQAAGRAVGPVWRAAGSRLDAAGLRLDGRVEVRRVPTGLQVVGHVPLEAYVAGTVGREVYADWQPEMLKAQAVVARTYALHERSRNAGRSYDLEGGTGGQVFGGLDAAGPSAVRATGATRGEYLAWGHRPILAVYHSASGGRTASAEEVWGRSLPYLRSIEVENEEDSPDTYWRAAASGTTLQRALEPLGIRVGPIRALEVLERSRSGRAVWLRVSGPGGTGELEARALRRVLGADVIRSTLFEIRPANGAFVFVGSGHGHGVGMSQWGAQAMAERGADYREILATFYPGTTLRRRALP